MNDSATSSLVINSVRPDASQPDQVWVNDRYRLPSRLFEVIRSSTMPEDLQIAAVLEAHYRKLLLSETSAERRKALYSEAYGDVSRVSHLRGQFNHGLSDNFAAYFMPLFRGADVLELGSGCGALLPLIKDAVHSYLGLDASEEAVAVARANNAVESDARYRYEVQSLVGGDIPKGFSVIYCNDFFEHLHPDDLSPVLARCHEALAPGGRLLAMMPNRLFGPFDISRRFLPIGSSCEALHLNEMTYDEARTRVLKAGFTNVRSNALGLRALLRLRGLLPGDDLMLTVPASFKATLERSGMLRRALSKVLSLQAVILIAEKASD